MKKGVEQRVNTIADCQVTDAWL